MRDGDVMVHRCVMASISPMIRDLLTGSNGKGAHFKGRVLKLTNMSWVSKQTMLEVVEFVYTGGVLLTSHNIDNMLLAAGYLQIKQVWFSLVLYTYTVSRLTYTDEYRVCIWMSLGEFRYERYESVYVTLLTV